MTTSSQILNRAELRKTTLSQRVVDARKVADNAVDAWHRAEIAGRSPAECKRADDAANAAWVAYELALEIASNDDFAKIT